MHVCDDLYVCDAVHVPNQLTCTNMGSTIDSQGAVNKEDLVTRGATDPIVGPSHLFSHHICRECRLSRKCVIQSEFDCGHQQVSGIRFNEILLLDTSDEVLLLDLEDSNCRLRKIETQHHYSDHQS